MNFAISEEISVAPLGNIHLWSTLPAQGRYNRIDVTGAYWRLRRFLSHNNSLYLYHPLIIPEHAVGFVARVASAMAARVSLRRNSPSYSDETKPSEAIAAAAIASRSRNPTAYSGIITYSFSTSTRIHKVKFAPLNPPLSHRKDHHSGKKPFDTYATESTWFHSCTRCKGA